MHTGSAVDLSEPTFDSAISVDSPISAIPTVVFTTPLIVPPIDAHTTSTPLEVPMIIRSAGRAANSPTVTTPVI
jgi:hypothetical protein